MIQQQNTSSIFIGVKLPLNAVIAFLKLELVEKKKGNTGCKEENTQGAL